MTIEPVKLTEPMTMVNAVAISWNVEDPPVVAISLSSTRATMAAAPPPTPLNRATSWGIWVICTRYAPSAPIPTPTTMAMPIGSRWSRSPEISTVAVARTAPAAPIRLPRRAVLGEESPLSARTKQTAATR